MSLFLLSHLFGFALGGALVFGLGMTAWWSDIPQRATNEYFGLVSTLCSH